MRDKNQYMYFVDCTLPNGMEDMGAIGWPYEDAVERAEEIRKEHPDWIVDVNAIEKAAA